MPYSSQAKLLRVLQERQVRPVGGAKEVPVDVRVIASTNRNVEEAIDNGDFREDLYYRLSVIMIKLPPLRAHLDDIPALVRHFISKFNSAFQRAVKGIDNEALELLSRYHWPGNVRELEGVIEHAFAFGDSDTIYKFDLPAYITERANAGTRQATDDQADVPTMFEAQKDLLVRALSAAGGNKSRAAQLLGISRPRLYKMMRDHRIE
jgi:transcriptional regulator with PAS, ATPase and Fis domain